MILGPAEVRDLCARHELRPRQSLGQNFVVDPNTLRRIATLAGTGAGDHVLEIGPGVGSLTGALAATGARVTAVEIDRRLLPVLDETLAGLDVRVVHDDATTVDLTTLGDPAVLVANLPYNVGTAIVLRLLADLPSLQRGLVMVQKEVADRLAAPPGSRVYGVPSVKVAWFADASVAGTVPPTVFWPQPSVSSALVSFARRAPAGPESDRATAWKLIDAGFGQRRKMLRRAWAGLVDDAQFAAAAIDPTDRAERLAVTDFARLAAIMRR